MEADLRVCSYGNFGIWIYEHLIPTERTEDPPVRMVWVAKGFEAFKQFKGQRVLSVIYEMNIEEGREYRGTLLRGEEQHMPAGRLEAEEYLRYTPLEYSPRIPLDSRDLELFTPDGYWHLDIEIARPWLYALMHPIIERKIWITRNGRYWRDGGIMTGDNFRTAGQIPTGLPMDPQMRINLAPRKFEGKAWWSD